MKKRLKCIAILLGLFLLLTACTADVQEVLEDGAREFSQGKEDVDSPYLTRKNMYSYVEAYDTASIAELSIGVLYEEDVAYLREKTEEEVSIGKKKSVIITSEEELKQQLKQMIESNKEYLYFTCANGYQVSSVSVTKVYDELKAENLCDVMAVKNMNFGGTQEQMLLQVEYDVGIELLDAMQDETREMSANAASYLKDTSLTTADQIKKVNDYLCEKITYPSENMTIDYQMHVAYGPLKNGYAVSDGYAKLCKLLLNQLGIECYYLEGTCNGKAHAWNLVNVDGVWYHLDVCYNDMAQFISDKYEYVFFLLSDSKMQEAGLQWDQEVYPETPARSY